MALKKRTNLITLLLATLFCAVLACASVITAFADDSSLSFEEEVALVQQEIIDSGILGDYTGDLTTYFADPNEDVKIAQLKKIHSLALLRNQYSNSYSDQAIAENVEPASCADVKEIRDQLLASFIVRASAVNGNANWDAQLNALQQDAEAKVESIQAIMEEDEANYNSFVADCAKSVVDAYDHLMSKNNAGGGNEFTVKGYYSSAHADALKAVLDEYVEEGSESETYQFVNPVVYFARDVKYFKDSFVALKDEAILALEALPRNSVEEAYQLYNDWLNLKTGDSTEPGYNDKVTETVAQLKKKAQTAIDDYEKMSEELQVYYSGIHADLVDFIENIDGYESYIPVRVSSIKDTHDVVKIVAKYSNGQIAEVLPENCVLVIYPTNNGAAKKNATTALKKISNDLSVAYFFTYRVIRNGISYNLPSKDSNNNKSVVYEFSIDLNKYYEKYCKPDERESDKTQNIKDAAEIITSIEDASLTYGYASGEIHSLDYTLEGGVLVFTATSQFKNLCFAGINLDNYLTNPLFWVFVVVGLIVLWIIFKIVKKHIKYTIKFNSNGGSPVESVRAAKGEYFVMPADPVKADYVFAGWYTNKECTERFVENYMRRRKGYKLYAKWVSPIASDRLIEMYDSLRDTMRSFKKESFKSLLGLVENEMIAIMYYKENHIQLNLALNPNDLKKEGIKFIVSKEKKFAEVPVQIRITTEEAYAVAEKLVARVLLAKGLQKIEDVEESVPSTEEERKNGFAYMIHNDRVASTAEDYFELLRIAVKSYVMESDSGKFKPGDKVTLARLYITNEVACLYLPSIKGHKTLKPARGARFEDTPVEVKILAPRDILDAYALIDEVMTANGFVKDPANASDLADVKVPTTNGFAYTLVF